MKPDVARVVLSKGLRRPPSGMPGAWSQKPKAAPAEERATRSPGRARASLKGALRVAAPVAFGLFLSSRASEPAKRPERARALPPAVREALPAEAIGAGDADAVSEEFVVGFGGEEMDTWVDALVERILTLVGRFLR
jgi:hypothetical protein